MTNQMIARRYARALLEVAKENNQQKEYGKELDKVLVCLNQVPELKLALFNPAISFSERKDLWQEILAYLQTDKLVSNFLLLLADRSRLTIIEDIQLAYSQYLDELEGIKRALVRSVAPLDQATLNALTSQLEVRTGNKIILEIKEDPSLIGGLIAQVGDLVLDGSIKGELARLKDSLTRGN